VKRLGMLGDWDKPYLTMDFDAEATIVAELLKFAESGQLYRGAKPVMWSPVEKTALAEAEVEYEDITSTQIDVAFEIVSSPIPELVGAHAVIWTTTPWTIPVNQAIAYGPDVEYVLVRIEFPNGVKSSVEQRLNGKSFLVADELFQPWLSRLRDSALLENRSDAEYTWMANVVPLGSVGKGRKISRNHRPPPDGPRSPNSTCAPARSCPAIFVTTDSGTGLVHMAPDHGEDDFDLCKAHGIDPVFAVEGDGKYRADWAWLGGQGSVINPKFNAPDGPICSDLREAGGLLARVRITSIPIRIRGARRRR
jgi:isoleucyl-tRNA synthetase